MRNSSANIFEKIQLKISRLKEIKTCAENELAALQKESARRGIIESIVFHETRIPIEAVGNIVAISPVNADDKPLLTPADSASAINFNMELISYIQSFMHPEFDPDFIVETEFDINELIFTAVCSVYKKFSRKNIKILTRFYQKPIIVSTDKYRLYCIILNLLDNGVKFSAENAEFLISVSLNEENFVRIEFLDHGTGFDIEKMKKLFPNGKLEVSLDDNNFQTGLLIVYKFLQDVKGYLELSTSENEGSAFSLCMKCSDNFNASEIMFEPTDFISFEQMLEKRMLTSAFISSGGSAIMNTLNAAAVSAPGPETKVFLKGSAENIILIDDDDAAVNLFKTHCESAGQILGMVFNIITVNIQENTNIIEEIQKYKPAAVFVEPMLKTSDGFAIIEKIRTDSETYLMPVIALSKIKCRNKASNFGASHYISKPVNNSSLIDAFKIVFPENKQQ
ncbi:MAG: ATP-binding protein [Candidatus Wallbacteria bacterium]